MQWSHVAALIALVVLANGGFVWAVKWLLSRDRKMLAENLQAISARVEKQADKHERLRDEVSKLKECMPREYVMREDWIRSFSQIDFKIDAIWEFIRDTFGGKQ